MPLNRVSLASPLTIDAPIMSAFAVIVHPPLNGDGDFFCAVTSLALNTQPACAGNGNADTNTSSTVPIDQSTDFPEAIQVADSAAK